MEITKGTVLAMLSLVSPLLGTIGWVLDRPVGLVVQDHDIAKALQKGMSFDQHCQTLRATSSIKQIEDKIAKAGSIPLFFYYRRSETAKKTVEIISDIYASGEVHGDKISGITFIVFADSIPELLSEGVYRLYVGADCINSCSVDDMIMDPDVVPALLKDIEKMPPPNGLVGVVGILDKFLPHETTETERMQFGHCVNEIVESLEMPDDSEAICDAFRRRLYAFVEAEDVSIWMLPKLPIEAIRRVDTDFFIKGKRLYMGERTFARIVDELTGTENIGNIKYALFKEGIIERSEDLRYVGQMHYTGADGKDRCKRMMKCCDIENLQIVGRPNIIEMAGGLKK